MEGNEEKEKLGDREYRWHERILDGLVHLQRRNLQQMHLSSAVGVESNLHLHRKMSMSFAEGEAWVLVLTLHHLQKRILNPDPRY